MSRSNAQKALYQRLLSADVTSLLSNNWGSDAVFAQVPKKKFAQADFPFVSIARGVDGRYDDKTRDGHVYRFQIDAWARSWAQVEALGDIIRDLLHRQDLTIDEMQVSSVDVTAVTLLSEQDEKTRRAIIDVEVMATATPWLLKTGTFNPKGIFGGTGTWGDPA